MTVHNPAQSDYDEELYSKLQPRSKEVLRRFFNYHSGNLDHRPIAEDSNFSKNDLCKIVAAELENELSNFFDMHRRFVEENVRTVPAIDYLAEHYEIDSEELDIDTRYELVLLLYEEDLIDRIDELITRSQIKSYSAKRSYILDRPLDFERLGERLEKFHREWNKKQEDPDAILVDKEFESENLVVLKIYQESTMQYPNTFSFRKQGKEDVPVRPELTRVQFQQLKTIRFQLEKTSSGTELVFTESFNRWGTTIDAFFESVFDLPNFRDKVEKASSPVAEEIEEEIVESIDQGEDPVKRARGTIDEKRKEAEARIDGLDIPETRKDEFKDRIETIEISGSEIVDDQSIETQEFRLIAGLDGLFKSVDIEEGFRDMLKKAESEKQSFVVTINDRPVQFSDGSWSKIGAGTLPDKDQRALQIFFDGDDGI